METPVTILSKVSTNPMSPHYNQKAADCVDKVYVNDVHVPNCAAYDMDMGWAFSLKDGVYQPKLYGEVRVVLKFGKSMT